MLSLKMDTVLAIYITCLLLSAFIRFPFNHFSEVAKNYMQILSQEELKIIDMLTWRSVTSFIGVFVIYSSLLFIERIFSICTTPSTSFYSTICSIYVRWFLELSRQPSNLYNSISVCRFHLLFTILRPFSTSISLS